MRFDGLRLSTPADFVRHMSLGMLRGNCDMPMKDGKAGFVPGFRIMPRWGEAGTIAARTSAWGRQPGWLYNKEGAL